VLRAAVLHVPPRMKLCCAALPYCMAPLLFSCVADPSHDTVLHHGRAGCASAALCYVWLYYTVLAVL
jgi:hypothetical protein